MNDNYSMSYNDYNNRYTINVDGDEDSWFRFNERHRAESRYQRLVKEYDDQLQGLPVENPCYRYRGKPMRISVNIATFFLNGAYDVELCSNCDQVENKPEPDGATP